MKLDQIENVFYPKMFGNLDNDTEISIYDKMKKWRKFRIYTYKSSDQCLDVYCLIISHEPFDRFASNFD